MDPIIFIFSSCISRKKKHMQNYPHAFTKSNLVLLFLVLLLYFHISERIKEKKENFSITYTRMETKLKEEKKWMCIKVMWRWKVRWPEESLDECIYDTLVRCTCFEKCCVEKLVKTYFFFFSFLLDDDD